jgi:hypothetical protein
VSFRVKLCATREECKKQPENTMGKTAIAYSIALACGACNVGGRTIVDVDPTKATVVAPPPDHVMEKWGATVDAAIPKVREILKAEVSAEQKVTRIRQELPNVHAFEVLHFRLGVDLENGRIDKESYLEFMRDIVPLVTGAGGGDGLLEVTEARFTRDAEVDLKVRNLGDTDIIIHRICIEKTEDHQEYVAPILSPTARYSLDVDPIPVGSARCIEVCQVVPARGADRITVALLTAAKYTLSVTLEYNKDKSVSFEVTTW